MGNRKRRFLKSHPHLPVFLLLIVHFLSKNEKFKRRNTSRIARSPKYSYIAGKSRIKV